MWFERQLKLQATTLLEKPHQNIFRNTQNPIFLRQQDDPFAIAQRSTTQITDICFKIILHKETNDGRFTLFRFEKLIKTHSKNIVNWQHKNKQFPPFLCLHYLC